MGKRRFVALLLCVGAFGLLSIGADSCSEAADDLEKKTTNNPEINKQVAAVPLGASVAEVEAQLGKPDDRQEFNTSAGKDESLYYGQWQLNFTNGKLESKNKY